MPTWKLLAVLGVVPIVLGSVVIAVGVGYDYFGKTPGTITIAGVSMVSAPWLILSAVFRSQAKALERKANAEAAEVEERVIAQRMAARVGPTGSFASLAVMQESGVRRLEGEQ